MTIRTAIKAGLAAACVLAPGAALAQPNGDPNFAGSYYEIPSPAPPAPQDAYAPPPAYSQPYAAPQYAPSPYPMQYAPASLPPPVVYAYPLHPAEWRRMERLQRRGRVCDYGYGCRRPAWR